jgi:hypothetical protein
MKKILCLIVLLAGVNMFTSCGKDDATYTAIPKLDVSKAEVLFESNGGTGSITINTSSPVTATTESTWLTVSANGNVVTATAPVNGSLDGRSATIIIKAGDAQAIVTATQKGSVYGINGGLEYELSDTAQAKVSIPVVQSAGVSVTSLADWLTASFNSETSTIEVVATSNDVEEPRIGYVAFQTGNVKDTLEIAQAGLLLNLEKLSIAVPNEGGIQSVTIEHSRPVTIETSSEWIVCAFNDKTNVLSISIDENKALARQGTITVKSLDIEKTISVIQYDPASLADQMFGDYYFVFDDEDGETGAFGATLTEKALEIPDLGWAIPVTINKEELTVSINSGSFVGTYDYYGMPLYMYLLFADETGEFWTADDTESVVSATLGLEDIGEGEMTLMGDFVGTFGEDNNKFGSFLFSAFADQKLEITEDNYLGELLQCFNPYLMKIPADPDAAAAAKRRASKASNVPFYLKKQRRFK